MKIIGLVLAFTIQISTPMLTVSLYYPDGKIEKIRIEDKDKTYSIRNGCIAWNLDKEDWEMFCGTFKITRNR